MISQILFTIITVFAFYYAFMQFAYIRNKVLLSKDGTAQSDNRNLRLKNVLLIALGQKKMFKRWIPAVFHLFIYVAFIFTQIELIEIFIDGFFGVHRFFADKLGWFYTLIISSIEILSALAFVATIVFLSRRNLLKVPRLTMPEMNGWPKLDGNLILYGELLLLLGITMMNGADVVLQSIHPEYYKSTGILPISGFLGPALFGGFEESSLIIIERIGWWLHVIVVYAFLNYLPKSKHLHIILAFPNTFYARLTSRGEMTNMPDIMNEVKSMMGLIDAPMDDAMMSEDIPEFGSKDVIDLPFSTILGAFTCTECGRCTDNCPANQTGKKLSPRKIMMSIRDRAEEIGENIRNNKTEFIKNEIEDKTRLTKHNYNDGKSLFDYISKEEIHACTSCNACVESCPVLINPLDPILELRRYEILTESAGPADWMPMFTSIENSGSVWQVSDTRTAWIED